MSNLFANYLFNEIRVTNSPSLVSIEETTPPRVIFCLLMGTDEDGQHTTLIAEVSKTENKVIVWNKSILDFVLSKAAAFERTFDELITVVVGYRPAR